MFPPAKHSKRPLSYGSVFFASIQQSEAPGQHIPPSSFEVIRIPWASNIAGVAGIVRQQTLLAAADAEHIPQTYPIYPGLEVVFVVIGAGELPHCFSGAGDAMLRQLVPRWESIPGHCFPQYNTLLPASRELSPNERRQRSALPETTCQ